MVERNVIVTNKLGLHLRAAALLVKTASTFRSEVRIRKGGVEVDAKSIMGILGLEGAVGSELTVKARGPDEREALAGVVGLIEAKFNEEE
jgi:phosphocarrier protein HPr